ncbi:MAG: hypothetical protein PUB14_03830 [Lachnospiraceae bacterium]|nr:hypothetical protein [Lachnospiraceae bacterium]
MAQEAAEIRIFLFPLPFFGNLAGKDIGIKEIQYPGAPRSRNGRKAASESKKIRIPVLPAPETGGKPHRNQEKSESRCYSPGNQAKIRNFRCTAILSLDNSDPREYYPVNPTNHTELVGMKQG